MRKMMTALLAMALAIPMLAFAQSGQMQDQQIQDQKNSQAEQNQASAIDETGQTTMPRHTMTGMVSNEGKSLTSGNTTYVVENSKALKNYDNQNVSVNFKFNTEQNTIHVLSVTPAQ